MGVIIALIASTLFIFTGASIAYLTALPILNGLIAGALFTALVFASNLLARTSLNNLIEHACLSVLLFISIVISWEALYPLLVHTPVRVETSLPLLLTTVALYILYLLLNQTGIPKKNALTQDKLAAFFSGLPITLTAIMALTISTYILLAIHYFQLQYSGFSYMAVKFLDRGIIPPITVFLFTWCVLMIINKAYTLWREAVALKKAHNKKSVLMQTYYQSLQETGSVQVENFIDLLWKKSADFYIIPRYINWAIPILGFIGTVLGISLAAEGIQSIISSDQSFGQLSTQLGQAIAPLGIAFDTTLIALSLSVALMLMQTSLQRWEDNLLIDYENKLRNMPLNAV